MKFIKTAVVLYFSMLCQSANSQSKILTVKDTTLLYSIIHDGPTHTFADSWEKYHYLIMTKIGFPGHWKIYKDYEEVMDFPWKGYIKEHWMKLDPDFIDSLGISHWYKNYQDPKKKIE